MNILYLSDTGNIIGGGEISLLNLFENLDKSVFTSYLAAPYEGDFTKKVKELNIPVITVPLKKIKNPLNILYTIKAVKRLIEIIKEHKIGLVHSNSSGGIAILGGIACYIAKIKFIWHVRVIESAGILDWIQSLFSTRIIVISKAVTQRFRWLPKKNKIVMIYNGVNTDRFSAAVDKTDFKKDMALEAGELLVGSVGRYHPIKGYEYLIKASKIVLQEFPNSRVIIAGFGYSPDNKYLAYLKKLSAGLKLTDKIVFMPAKDNIQEFLSALDIFVFPSLNESFGRVIIEAMACAKPVVSFSGGAAAEIIENNATGFLVPCGNFQAMAEKTIFLLKNGDIRVAFGKSARRRAEQLFSIKDNVKNIEKLYSELQKGYAKR